MQGTVERLSAVGLAFGPNENGDPDYTGQTEIFWESEATVRDDTTDERMWLCEEGSEWRESELLIVEVDDE